MPNSPDLIKAPDDTITGMARRAYGEYAHQHSSMGMKFPPFDQLGIAARANWKLIVAKALGMKVDVVNVNRMERKPHVVILTGFTDFGARQFREGIEAKLAAQAANMERITSDDEAGNDDGHPGGDAEPGGASADPV